MSKAKNYYFPAMIRIWIRKVHCVCLFIYFIVFALKQQTYLFSYLFYQSEGFPRTGYLFPARDGLWPGLKKEVLLTRRRRRRRRRHLGIGSFLSQLPT